MTNLCQAKEYKRRINSVFVCFLHRIFVTYFPAQGSFKIRICVTLSCVYVQYFFLNSFWLNVSNFPEQCVWRSIRTKTTSLCFLLSFSLLFNERFAIFAWFVHINFSSGQEIPQNVDVHHLVRQETARTTRQKTNTSVCARPDWLETSARQVSYH